VSRYEVLLFLHLLGAFAVVAALLATTALAAGWPPDEADAPTRRRVGTLGARMFDIGGLVVLVFGVWLALDVEPYKLTDGWILGALALWVVAAGAGSRSIRAYRDGTADGTARLLYAATAAAVLAMLVLMIFKPGAGP
jgi:uncharacterized membrane protein